jgi:YegS/Rv2252/BmrU family lipid kinase
MLPSVPAPTLVIVNPRSGAGTTGRLWKKIEPRLRSALGDLEVELTKGPRDAVRIAREGVRAGARRLIVAGGDGTGSEVVTGLLGADLGEHAELGFLPLGSGCDFARGIGLPRDPEKMIALLRDGSRMRSDAGRVTYQDEAGEQRSSYFLNIGSLGISGLTDLLVNQAGKWLGPGAAFVVGTLRAIVRYRAAEIEIDVDGEPFHRGSVSMAVAANGRFFGSGMQVAPGARIDDGAFEVVVVGELSKPRLVAALPSIYRGRHFDHPAVTHTTGSRVEARITRGDAILIDVDGEPLGHLPVRFDLLPSAVRLFGLPPQASARPDSAQG